MGRILALDYGTRRIGAAVSDPSRTIASPLEVYERRGPVRDAAHYRGLAAEERIERIVVGLPLHTGGGEGELAAQARAFAAWVAAVTGLPVVLYDERYTSVQAEEILREHRVSFRDRKALRDRLAAQILLRAYLEAGCPEVEAPAAPLADAPEAGEEAER